MPPVRMKGTARPRNTKKTIARLVRYLGGYKALLAVVAVAVLVSAGAQVACDSLLRPAIDDYIEPLMRRFASGERIAFADYLPFLRLIAMMAAIFACGALATWVNLRLMLYVSTRTLYRVRTDLFRGLEKLPLRYFDARTHGELMSLFTNDTDTLRDMLSQSVPQLFSSAVTVISVLVMMLVTSPLLTAVMLVSMVLVMALAGAIGKRSAVAFRAQQDAIGTLNGYVQEMMAGQRVVKVFNHERKAMERFNELNDSLCAAGTRANTFANILMPVMGNLSHVQYALIAIAGAFLVMGGSLTMGGAAAFLLFLRRLNNIVRPMSTGGLASFLQYTRSFNRPITMMSQQLNGVLNALAGAERIFSVIDEEPEPDEGTVTLVNATETAPAATADGKPHLVQAYAQTGEWAWRVGEDLAARAGLLDDPAVALSYADTHATKLVRLRGDVVFSDVSFSYVPEKEVLHHISLHARPGEKIALVGSTGSGKTTITNLLTRFYDVEDGKGTITYDGIPLKEISKDALRRSLGMVLQDTHLFTGTIRENIKYGKLDASEAQVLAAAKLANADGFIRHLEHGYDTVISGDGGNLSQGQRQLLAIARAAVADPPVLILDEATSSIDTRTESLIEKGMDCLMEGRTVFVIAHRLSTVRNAKEIIVLEQGSILERGSHDELIARRGRYYQLYTGGMELD